MGRTSAPPSTSEAEPRTIAQCSDAHAGRQIDNRINTREVECFYEGTFSDRASDCLIVTGPENVPL